MAELQYVKLSDEEVSDRLGGVDGWAVENGQLAKTFAFANYLAGMDFASNIGRTAEELNHHPDILVTWCKVRVAVNTHDVGGISPYDFELARRVDELASS
jgi:4a-hydroxytetrahydrobiopterin dehydratase